MRRERADRDKERERAPFPIHDSWLDKVLEVEDHKTIGEVKVGTKVVNPGEIE